MKRLFHSNFSLSRLAPLSLAVRIRIDTGCLYGGKLTAVILELGVPARRVQVRAKRVYVEPKFLRRDRRAKRRARLLYCFTGLAAVVLVVRAAWAVGPAAR